MTTSIFFSFVVFALLSTSAYASPVTAATQIECATPPPPENGAVQIVYSTSYQLLAVFVCDEDFTAVGETVLSCVDGEWDKTAPFCASISHCNLKAKASQRDEFVNASLIRCGKLNAPPYGKVNIVKGNDGEIATFSCVPGYYVYGASGLHCERGVWDKQEPECKPIDCGVPEAPVNGTVEFEDTHYRAVAQYRCGPCLELEGYERRTCKRSGLWSKTTPQCVSTNEVACPLPFIPGGGFIPDERGLKINGVVCGQDVGIQCFSGYRLTGARSATCNPDGTYSWHGSLPRCRRLRWSR